jgi:hypothetical protein
MMVDLKDLNASVSTNIAIFFMSFVAPGFLIVFLINEQLFLSMDFWKLFILSTAITVPAFAFTVLVAASTYFHVLQNYPGHEVKWGGPREWYIRLGFGNSLSMYSIALLVWIFDFGVRGFIVCGVITVFLNVITEFYYLWLFIRDPESFNHGWLSAVNRLLK